jgi:hypothetical protein
MALVALPAGAWTAVVTTTVSTAIQNKGGCPVTLTTEDPTALPRDSGFVLNPGDALAFEDGVTVNGYPVGSGAGVVYVGDIGA